MEMKKLLRNFGKAERQTLLELAERYESLGYRIKFDYHDEGIHCDMMAEKEGNIILFEIKAGPFNDRSRERIEHIKEYASQRGMKFKLVFARQEPIPQIEVEGLKESLELEFINNLPSDLDSLSTHTRVVEVEDVYITSLKVCKGGEMLIKGSSEVIVDLIYGSEDGDTVISDSFPFTFSGLWSFDDKEKLKLDVLEELDIDTSSFEE